MTTVIMVISDTHRELREIQAEIIRRPGIDRYFHLGDHASDAEELENRTGRRILAVRGNNDYFEVGTPRERILEIEGRRLLLVHGNGFGVHTERESLVEYAKTKNCDLVLYGHTHVFRDEVIDCVRIINPGAMSHPRDGVKGYAILTIDGKQVDVTHVTIDQFIS